MSTASATTHLFESGSLSEIGK